MPKNPEKCHLGSLKVFFQTENIKEMQGVPFDKIRKFSKVA